MERQKIKSFSTSPALAGALALVLLLSGCSGTPQKSERDKATSGKSVNVLIQEAERAEAAGNLVQAAQTHQTLAWRLSGDERNHHLLRAAEMLFQSQYGDQAKALLKDLNSDLSPKVDADRRLLQARIALAEQAPQQALKLLTTVPAGLAMERIRMWLSLQSRAFAEAGNYLEAARSGVELGKLPAPPEERHENNLRIWNALQKLNPEVLSLFTTLPPPDVLSGWLELARYSKESAEQPSRLKTQIEQWRKRYPGHPAAREFSDALLGIGDLEARPQKIALLLPLSGALAAPAQTLLDGFMAAHFNRPDRNYVPTIRVYDTHSDITKGLQAYHKAVSEGAELIVGPLNKQLAEAVAALDEIPVQTLALNYIGEEALINANFYQYGLLPEDEAGQVAGRAWLDGHSNAVVLAPEGEWGQRMISAFEQQWQAMNGTTLAVSAYDPRKNDFAAPIRDMLAVDASRSRHKSLERLLDQKLKFEPRRRQDVDFVFVAAFPRQARVIRPQLKFYYAGDLPVYSTSHLYSGEKDRGQDRDMDGITFCDMPWVFTGGKGSPVEWSAIKEEWPATAAPYKRLYAMGIDAFALSGKLNYLARFKSELHYGMTGNLYLDNHNRVHRQLFWAKFSRGTPRMIDATPVPPANEH